MRTAVYPGSFDPFTNGHIDIAERASLLFDELIIAVFARPTKNLIFSVDERVDMARQALLSHPNIRVETYDGLTVDYLKKVGASTIVRGLRAVADFESELQMAHMNRQLSPGTETVCLITAKQYSFVSSTLIREIASLGADLAEFVPAHVAAALKKRFDT